MFLRSPSRNVQFEATSNKKMELKKKKRTRKSVWAKEVAAVLDRKEVRWPDLVFI